MEYYSGGVAEINYVLRKLLIEEICYWTKAMRIAF